MKLYYYGEFVFLTVGYNVLKVKLIKRKENFTLIFVKNEFGCDTFCNYIISQKREIFVFYLMSAQRLKSYGYFQFVWLRKTCAPPAVISVTSGYLI